MTDRYEFVTRAAEALRRGDATAVDLTAVAEELEQVGRTDSRELRHRIERLLEHMLKLRFVPSPENCRLWNLSVIHQRNEIEGLFDDSPSLRTKLTPELLARCYTAAAVMVAAEYGVDLPASCPWTWDDALRREPA